MVSDREDRWETTAGKWERFVTWFTPGRLVLSIVAFVLVLGGAGFGWRWITAEPKGALEAREQTVGDGKFRIAAYDEFFELCTAVQTKEAQIASLEEERDTTSPSPSRLEQINASLTALRGSRDGTISEYNNNANRDYTVGQFRDSNLPYPLDPTQEQTTCTA